MQNLEGPAGAVQDIPGPEDDNKMITEVAREQIKALKQTQKQGHSMYVLHEKPTKIALVAYGIVKM